jgi:hypothetical protein
MTVCVHVSLCKVHPTTGHEGPEGEIQIWLYSFFNLGARGGVSVPQGQYGWVWKTLPALRLQPQTIHPAAGCYTNCTTLACVCVNKVKRVQL